MILITEEKLFDENGTMIESLDNQLAMDSLVLILQERKEEPSSTNQLNLELRRCGFFLTNPMINLLLKSLEKSGLLKMEEEKTFSPETTKFQA